MSFSGEPSHENSEMETDLQQDEEPLPDQLSSKRVQVKDKRPSSPLTLLKDFNQFKEGVKKKFKDKDTKTRANQSMEKLVRPLSLLKEDLSLLKEDLASVFRSGLSKDQENKDETVKEDPSNNSRVKTCRTGSAKEPLKNLFRRQSTPRAPQMVKKSDEQTHLTKPNIDVDTGKSNTMKNGGNKSEDSEKNVNQTRQRTLGSKTGHSAAVQKWETEDWSRDSVVSKTEDELSGTPLNFRLNVFTLNVSDQPREDLWSPKNYATYLTLDPNTANAELRLADGNRRAIRDWLAPRPSDHPDRFQRCPQVLCREGLLDLVYWEVVWTGGADIGVTYNSISRYGDSASCLLGHNERSWSLECSEGSYTPCHNNRRFKSSSPEPFTRKVGVYLNCPTGTLSFYCIAQDSMVHLHTFTSTFTEPLYPGFWVWAGEGSVSLCQVELDWERLLQ